MDRIGYAHVHDEVRKPTDGVCALYAVYTSETRKALRSVEHVSRSLSHLGEEREAKTWNARFIVIGCFLELGLGFRLDEDRAIIEP